MKIKIPSIIKNLNTKSTLYLLVILAIALVIIVFGVFSRTNKSVKVSLGDIKIGYSREVSIVNSLVPVDYKFSSQKAVEPSVEGEKEALKFANDLTKVLHNPDGGQNDTVRFRPPKGKDYLGSEQMSRNLYSWAYQCVLLNHDSTVTKPVETSITYSSVDKYIVKVLVDDMIFYDNGPSNQADLNCRDNPSKNIPTPAKFKVDSVLEYTITRDTNDKKLYLYSFLAQHFSDISQYRDKVVDSEISSNNNGRQSLSLNTFTPSNSEGFNYSKIKNVDQQKVKKIFSDNALKTVILTANGPDGMGAASGYGFFVKKGIIATSWKVVESFLKNDIINRYAVDFDGKLHKIQGVVSVSQELDIALLKLEDDFGEPVKFGDSSKLKFEDPIVVIGSPMGITPVTRVGLFNAMINEGDPFLRLSLPLDERDKGSPLFNINGEVVGINTSVGGQKINGDTSLARPAELFDSIAKKLSGQSFKDIKYTNFADLRKEINKTVVSVGISKVSENNSLWKSYIKQPSISQFKSVKLLESRIKGSYLVIRYQNTISEFLETDSIINSYGKKLKEAGYKLIYEKNGKFTYVKAKDVIRLSQRYDYISVIYERQS